VRGGAGGSAKGGAGGGDAADVSAAYDAAGGAAPSLVHPRNLVLGGYFLQSSPIGGAAVFGGATLGYRRLLGSGRYEVGARATVARFDADDRGYRSSLVRAGVAVDGGLALVSRRGLRLSAGGTLGVPVTRQRDLLGEERISTGLRYGARAALVFWPAGPLLVGLDLEAGAESMRIDGTLAHRPFAGAGLSVGFGFN
jgi:hypothetical protein